jgi:dolichol kinase
MLVIFISAGYFTVTVSDIFYPVTTLVFIGTAVESLPFHDIDNLTIPAATMIAGSFLF